MNYLVMISEYYPLPSANGICAKNIVECFDKNDNFYIVGTNRHSSIEYETISDNCELFRINGKNLYKKKMFFFRFLSFLKLLFSSGLCNSLVQSYYRKGRGLKCADNCREPCKHGASGHAGDPSGERKRCFPLQDHG